MVRFKNRYALCELIFPDHKKSTPPNVDTSKVYQAVRNAILDAHGDYGLGALQFSLSVKYLNLKTNIVIIRGERNHFEMLSSAVVFIRKIGGHKVIMRTLHVGGSIRACQKFLIGYHKRNLTLLYPECTTDEQRAQVMQSIMEVCDELENLGSKSKSTTASSARSILQPGEGDS